jgi:hypothetical protein
MKNKACVGVAHHKKKMRFSDTDIWDIFCQKNAPNDLATLY